MHKTRAIFGRLLFVLLLFVGSTFLVFLLVSLRAEQLALGEVLSRYGAYLVKFVRFDLGLSERYQPGAPVVAIVTSGFRLSLGLVGFALMMSFSVSLLYGVWATGKSRPRAMHPSGWIVLLVSATPVFVLGYLARDIINPIVGELYQEGVIETPRPYLIGIGSGWLQYSLAALTLGLGDGFLANLCFTLRDDMADVREQDYVESARMNAVGHWKHITVNVVVPFIASLSARLSVLLGGVIIVETLYSLNGAGRIFWRAALTEDFDVLLATTVFFCLLVACVQWAYEVVRVVVDPRLKQAT